jgi:hypothetical protein
MRRSLAISSTVVTALAGLLSLGLVAACGGKGKADTTPAGHGGPSALAARLPWEIALVQGATFTLRSELEDDDGVESVTLKVTAVEEDGGARVYRLDWGEEGANGPAQLRVEGSTVTVGDAKPEDMQEPYSPPGGDTICYGADYSNPEGCEDVCDASLCLGSTGIVEVTGLYAPNYGMYSAE